MTFSRSLATPRWQDTFLFVRPLPEGTHEIQFKETAIDFEGGVPGDEAVKRQVHHHCAIGKEILHYDKGRTKLEVETKVISMYVGNHCSDYIRPFQNIIIALAL